MVGNGMVERTGEELIGKIMVGRDGYEKENRIKENKGREVNGEIIVGNGLVINEDGRTFSRESNGSWRWVKYWIWIQ